MKINNKLFFIVIIILLIVVIGVKVNKNNSYNEVKSTDNIVKENTVQNLTNNIKENNKFNNEAIENTKDNTINNEQNTTNMVEENTVLENEISNDQTENKILDVTYETFEEEVIKSDKIVIVDFWASWCSYCLKLSPILEEIANENDDIVIRKVNVDEEVKLAGRYHITSLPTMMIFKDGKEQKMIIGYNSKQKILQYINSIK